MLWHCDRAPVVPHPFSAIIFDLDGTLIESTRDITTAVNVTLTELRLPSRAESEVRAFIGEGVGLLMERALPAGNLHLREEALTRFLHHYGRELLRHTRPYPGVRDLLDRLDGMPLAVATNKQEGLSRRIVDGLGLTDYFRALIGGDVVSARKPDPEMLFLAAQRLGVDASQILVVGDGRPDVEAARAGGMISCAVSWGYRSSSELKEDGADFVIDSPLELLQIVA